MLLCLVMILSSQGIMRSQMRIIPKEKRDSVIQSTRKLFSIEGLAFDSLSVNFGLANENDAPIPVKYRFSNSGKSDINLSGISTSCSCLKATLSKRMLKPGESAEIVAEYNQKGHPGRHDRYIYLYCKDPKSGESSLSATLMLSGTVVSEGAKLKYYPVGMGYFSFSSSSLTFSVGKASKQTLKFVNTSDSARTITFSSGLLPKGLTLSSSVVRVPAGGESSVVVSYDGGNSVHASQKSIPLLFDGAGLNRLYSKIDVFFAD